MTALEHIEGDVLEELAKRPDNSAHGVMADPPSHGCACVAPMVDSRIMSQERIERTCPNCANTYLADPVRLKHGRQTSCSRQCSYALRAKAQTTAIPITCDFCGGGFDRWPSRIERARHHKFCSAECRAASRKIDTWPRTVRRPYSYSSGGRTALSRNGARLYAKFLPKGPSPHEVAVAARLSEAHLEFAHQHVIDFADTSVVVDFYLPPTCIVVEIDGDEHQHRRMVEKDKRRDLALGMLGLKVLRVAHGATPAATAAAALKRISEALP